MSMRPSMPSDGTQVLPSASMQVPLVQAVAKLLQSSFVVHFSQACVADEVLDLRRHLRLQEADDDALEEREIGDACSRCRPRW